MKKEEEERREPKIIIREWDGEIDYVVGAVAAKLVEKDS